MTPSETGEVDLPIVAAVDGSSVSYDAAAWAGMQAAVHGRRLHLIISMFQTGYSPAPLVAAATVDRMRDDAEQILGEAERIARTAAPDVAGRISSEVIFDPVIPSLITRSRKAWTLVLGGRGRGALRRTMLGSVTSAMVRHAHCPVAVVHTMPPTDAAALRKPVLVGVDGGPNSVAAIEFAFQEASLRKIGVTALHSWNDSGGIEIPLPEPEWVRESEDALITEVLDGPQSRYPDVPVRRILGHDKPARALFAESDNAQMVVVGSHGRGGFTGMLLGSTSAALVQSAACPVVVVRERESE